MELSMRKFLSRFLTISSTDPDDTRRRRILNILLVGIGAMALIALVVSLTPFFSWENVKLLVFGSAVTLLGVVIIYLINTSWSGRIAATIFLVFLTAVFAFGDTPEQVAGGRSLIFFTIPIIMASILLAPWSGFIFSSISSLIISVIALSINQNPNIPAMTGFFVIALVSWLSARSLDQTLQELRTINANLDQVVIERTRSLTESLARERIEAGQ